MIGSLSGNVVAIDHDEMLIEVKDVGYEVTLPLRVASKFAVGDPIFVYTHFMLVNEAQALFGFDELSDRVVFRRLLKAPKFGARMSVKLLSELSGPQIVHALQRKDISLLSSVSGIGRKTAENLEYWARDQIQQWGVLGESVDTGGSSAPAITDTRSQVVSALRGLGYLRTQAESAVTKVWRDDADIAELTRAALQVL